MKIFRSLLIVMILCASALPSGPCWCSNKISINMRQVEAWARSVGWRH